MEFSVDRELPVPLRTQLQGMIEYGIACGELAPGDLLPSVRDLAERAGVAPMTVSQVYADLKAAGLIETRPGAGTFVTGSPRSRVTGRPDAAALHRHIDALIDEGTAIGMRPSELVALVSSRIYYRDSIGQRLRIVMVGVFPDATASYAKAIAAHLGNTVTVEPATIATLERSAESRARANSADIVVTFVNRHREVASLVPSTKLVTISFIPSEDTRRALASIDPLARVLVISLFPDFLPVIKAGVQRFAPHVREIVGATLGADADARLAEGADIVVYATGSESIVEKLPAGVQALEYRHTPDAGDVRRVLEPMIRGAPGGDASNEMSLKENEEREAS